MEHKNWHGFKAGVWQDEINVRDFIQQNYTEYKGDSSFLKGATPRTEALMKKLQSLFTLERQYGGVLDIDTATVSSLTSYSPGYIDKDNEIIVGMQTNRPLKRGVSACNRNIFPSFLFTLFIKLCTISTINMFGIILTKADTHAALPPIPAAAIRCRESIIILPTKTAR